MSDYLRSSVSFFMGETEDDEVSTSWINDILGDEISTSIFCGGGGYRSDSTDHADQIRKRRSARTRTLWVRVRILGQYLRKKGILQTILISRLIEATVEIEPTLTTLLNTIANNSKGELVGLDNKFKSKESLEQKVSREVHEANLKLLEELDKQRHADHAVADNEKRSVLEDKKLRRKSMTLVTGLDEQSKQEAVLNVRKEAELLANQHFERANQVQKSFEDKANKLSNNTIDIEKIVWEVSDALRYTVLLNTETYTRDVKNALKLLESHGLTPAKLKNYWGEGDGYQGINDVFFVPCDSSPTGKVKVEIQFHTHESFNHKMAVHGMYEEFRSTRDPTRKVELWKESVRMADEIPVPEGVLELPKLTTQPMPIENTLYVDLVLSRSLKIQKPAIEAVTRALSNMTIMGESLKKVNVNINSFLMSPSALESRMNNEVKNAKNEGQELGLKEAALNIRESLVITVVFEEHVYAHATEEALNRLFLNPDALHEKKTTNSWNSPMLFGRSGPTGGVGVQCNVTMEGEDDGVAFTLDDAYPLVIAFHTQESLKARIGLQAAWSEYRAASTKKQRDSSLARGRRLVEEVAVPEGSRSILNNRWILGGNKNTSFMQELQDIDESKPDAERLSSIERRKVTML